MLWTIIVILVILWLLGFLGPNYIPSIPKMGNAVHVLIVIVVILVILNLAARYLAGSTLSSRHGANLLRLTVAAASTQDAIDWPTRACLQVEAHVENPVLALGVPREQRVG